MSRTVIIAQARMSSTRLPGKTLMDLCGRPVIDHVIERARHATLADDVVIATTTDSSDDVLVAHLELLGARYVRGSLDDVLARYVVAAESAIADVVVRITCDCPLIDPAVIDATIAAFRAQPEVDYCSNTLVRTYPIGMDTEVFTRSALERANVQATLLHEREHVTPHLYQHPEIFRLRNIEAPGWARWPELRLTLDETPDLELMRTILAQGDSGASLRAIVDILRADSSLSKINHHVTHRHVDKPPSW